MDLSRPDPVAARVVDRLRAAGFGLATAESLTGGLVGAALTTVPGASDVYVGGVVSYATALKVSLLGVPQAVVDRQGVVSRACAEAMADGVRGATGADVGVSTTGVAGPGPQDGVAVGTVWVAVCGPWGTSARDLHVDGDRAAVRLAACRAVLDLLADEIQPSA